MKVYELQNLYTAVLDDNFTICVCAEDEESAKEVAKGYAKDANFSTENIKVRELDEEDDFDCDYVLSANDIQKEHEENHIDSREFLKPKYDFSKPPYIPEDVSLCCDETYSDEEIEM